jgi:hypothetical protein
MPFVVRPALGHLAPGPVDPDRPDEQVIQSMDDVGGCFCPFFVVTGLSLNLFSPVPESCRPDLARPG